MRKLPFRALLSSVVVSLALLTAGTAQAHEVQPAIADIEVEGDTLRLSFALTLESYLSGIDLDGLQDTNEAPQRDVYDSLRALDPGALAAQVPGLVAAWSALPMVQFGDQSAPLTLVSTDVPDVGNLELLRVSEMVLTAPVLGDAVQITWPDGAGDIVLRQQGVAEAFTGFVSGGNTSEPIALAGGDAKGAWGTFAEYIPVGFDHILPKGLDHILFVLGLFFLSLRLGALLWQVTAFTAAHTVTLALGALGFVTVPGSIVEPLIAASIVYVAVENIFSSKLNPWRPVVVFLFGLLHGLGFASVLGEFGLPEAQFVPALLGFNVGVEVGQLTVIAIALVLVGWAAKREWYRPLIAIPASAGIALVGAYWVIERTLL